MSLARGRTANKRQSRHLDPGLWISGLGSFPLPSSHLTHAPQPHPILWLRKEFHRRTEVCCGVPTGSAGKEVGIRGVGAALTHGPLSLRWVLVACLETNKALSPRCPYGYCPLRPGNPAVLKVHAWLPTFALSPKAYLPQLLGEQRGANEAPRDH